MRGAEREGEGKSKGVRVKERDYTPMRDTRGYMKPNQVARVIRGAQTERDRLLMEVLLVTGARVSEVVDRQWGIKPSDLVPEDNVIIFQTLKRSRGEADAPRPPPERRVIVPAWLMERLLKFSRNTPAETRIFPITRVRVYQIVEAAGERAGVTKVGRKKLHPHHFRHTSCIMYVKANNTMEGLRKLQRRLMHASINSTAFYLQFDTKGEQQAIEEIFKDI